MTSFLSSILAKSKAALSGPVAIKRGRRSAMWALLGGCVLFILYGLSPLFEAPPSEIPASINAKILAKVEEVRKINPDARPAYGFTFSFDEPVSLLVSLRVTYPMSQTLVARTPAMEFVPRTQQIIFFIAAAVILFMIYYTSSFEERLPNPVKYKEPSDLDIRFLDLVDRTRSNANRQFNQARLMLVSGIAIAMAGIGIFYTILVLPEPRSEFKSPTLLTERLAKNYNFLDLKEEQWKGLKELNISPIEWTKMVLEHHAKVVELEIKNIKEAPWSSEFISTALPPFRSFALFLAFEAVAWFLLRQYRFAINDYKQLMRLNIRRENYFLASLILQNAAAPDDRSPAALVASILQEDVSGKLRGDETTEELANNKFVESNPITDIWKPLIDKLPVVGGRSADPKTNP